MQSVKENILTRKPRLSTNKQIQAYEIHKFQRKELSIGITASFEISFINAYKLTLIAVLAIAVYVTVCSK